MQRQLKQAGQAHDVIPDAPVLSSALSMYYDAFFELCTTRSVGMGMSPISILNVDQYAFNRQYDEYQLYFLRMVVNKLDPIFMEHSKDDVKGSKGSKKPKRAGSRV